MREWGGRMRGTKRVGLLTLLEGRSSNAEGQAWECGRTWVGMPLCVRRTCFVALPLSALIEDATMPNQCSIPVLMAQLAHVRLPHPYPWPHTLYCHRRTTPRSPSPSATSAWRRALPGAPPTPSPRPCTRSCAHLGLVPAPVPPSTSFSRPRRTPTCPPAR